MAAIDISSYQRHPDFAHVKAAGVTLVIMKCADGEGSHISDDSVYAANRDAARAQGLAVGSYYFNGNAASPTAAADHQFAIIDWRAGDVVAIDVEGPAGIVWSVGQVLEWVTRMLNHGVPASSLLVYMSGSLTSQDWSSVIGTGARLWVASYGANDPTNPGPHGSPAVGQWGSYALWQYTSVATCPGISGYVDTNVFGTATAGLFSTLIGDEMSAAAEQQIAEIHAALVNGQQPHLDVSTVQQVFNAATDVQTRLMASTGGGWDAFDELIRNTRAIKAALAALPATSTGGVDLSSVMSALTGLEQQGADYQAQLLTSIKALPDATLATFGLKRA